MTIKIAVLLCYFAAVLVIGLIARSRIKETPQSYFLADRTLGSIVLLGTMAATNFSAFTIFGTSGAGYRDGYAFFPIMGFGTGFMALTFWLIGRKAWRMGKERGILTPPELVKELYGSRLLSSLFSIVMIVFTIPYLALQPMAAGYALEELFGLPYLAGCSLVTALIVVYTFRGGMKAVAWTDLFQGFVMVGLLTAAFFLTASHHGGLAEAHRKVLAQAPALFSRPGGQGAYTVGIWMSYMMLWFFCDPMFPQLFQRFFAAGSEKALGKTVLWYPAVCTVIFFLPISIGVMGRLSFPDLAGKAADRIIPMVMNAVGGDLMAALVVTAGLAALMSTMDSQLLTLGSLFTRDLLPGLTAKRVETSLPGRIFVIVLALAGLALAYKPPATILQIATQTFTGLAVLFPTVFFGLYLRRVYAPSAILSILTGESLLILFYLKVLSPGPFLPVVWIMLGSFGTYLAAHVYFSVRSQPLSRLLDLDNVSNPYAILFFALFLLATDFWAWNSMGPAVSGIPFWLLYFVLLSIIQTVLTYMMLRERSGSVTSHK